MFVPEIVDLNYPTVDTFNSAWLKVNRNFTNLAQDYQDHINKQDEDFLHSRLFITDIYYLTYASFLWRQANPTATIAVMHILNQAQQSFNRYYSPYTILLYSGTFSTLEPRFTGNTSYSLSDVKAVMAVDILTFLSGTSAFSNSAIASHIDTLTVPGPTSGTVVNSNARLTALKNYISFYYPN